MTDREKALADARAAIEKRWGEDTFGFSESAGGIPSGSLSLDRIIGTGGFPRGGMVMLAGEEGVGKSTLAIQACANAQRAGGHAAYIDMEAGMDFDYARALGVDTDKWLYSMPNTGEQVLEITNALVDAGIDLVVIDSVATLTTEDVVNGDVKAKQYASVASLLSNNLPNTKRQARKNGSSILLVNQLRDDLGNVDRRTGRVKQKAYGGWTGRHSPDVIIFLRPAYEQGIEWTERQKVRAVTDKNRYAPPHQTAEFYIEYGKGVIREEEILDIAFQDEILQMRGAYVYMDGENVGYKKDIRSNQDLFDAIAA